jgi:hypothetical protein
MNTCGALTLKLNIYFTPNAARFARELFLTPPLRRPLRHDSTQNCFSRHRCGAHCGTICPEIVSHATVPAPIAARFRPTLSFTPPFLVSPTPPNFFLAMSTYGAFILKLNIYCTPTVARFARKLFLTPPLRRPLRHDLTGNCFSRHRCGVHCGTICTETVSHATVAAPIAARFRPKLFLTPPLAVPPTSKISLSP